MGAPDYLNPDLPGNLDLIEIETLDATTENPQGFGYLVDNPHPGIWHEGVYAMSGEQRFLYRQGTVHTRISADFAREFNSLVSMSLAQQKSLDTLARI